jgi:beta-lactam-binding protein with PASTA domain
VSSGKVKVPDEVGADRSVAQQALSDLKLKTTTTFKDSPDKPQGTVLSQTHVGDSVDVGTVIALVVAQTPAPTTPPPTDTATATPTDTATTAP